MARVINAFRSRLIGTPDQIQAFLTKVGGDRSATIDLSFSRIYLLKEPLTDARLRRILLDEKAKPKRKRK